MKCPNCNNTFPLTWSRYFKSPFGKHICPSCHKESVLKFSKMHFLFKAIIIVLLLFFLYLVLLIITSGNIYSFIPALVMSLILALPIDKFHDEKFKKLEPKDKAIKFDKIKMFIKVFFVGFILSLIAILFAQILYNKFILKNTHLVGNVSLNFKNKTFIPIEEEVVKGQEPKYNRIIKYFINYAPPYVLVVTQYKNNELSFNDACKNFQKIDSLKVDEHKFYIMKHKDYITFATNYELKIFLDFEYLFGDLSIKDIKKLVSGINFKFMKKE